LQPVITSLRGRRSRESNVILEMPNFRAIRRNRKQEKKECRITQKKYKKQGEKNG